jgi:hypothetical protein
VQLLTGGLVLVLLPDEVWAAIEQQRYRLHMQQIGGRLLKLLSTFADHSSENIINRGQFQTSPHGVNRSP